MPKNNGATPGRVLITRFSALGDVAMTIPVVYPVCKAHPQVQFTLVTRPAPAGVFVDKPANLTVLGIDLNNYKGMAGPTRLARELQREHHFDAMADLHSVLRTWLMSATLRLHGVRVATIHKGRREKRRITGGKSRTPIATTHERYRHVFTRLGLTPGEPFTGLVPPPGHIAPRKEAGEQWIAIAPFSQHEGKVYPWPLMQQVIYTLAAREHCRIFLLGGGKRERDALEPVAASRDNVTSVAHIHHTFADELHLLSRCDVMVTMDSANMHLASLVRLPAVSIWGATHPICGFMGWGQQLDDAVQLPLPCRPCSVFGNKACRLGDYRCMNGITPAMIIEKVDQVLARTKD